MLELTAERHLQSFELRDIVYSPSCLHILMYPTALPTRIQHVL
jgi:hypothetical protein